VIANFRNWLIFNFRLQVLMSGFLLAGCSVVGKRSADEPSFTLQKKDGVFEVRHYGRTVYAETVVDGAYAKTSGVAFSRLAGYIFGKNRAKQKIKKNTVKNLYRINASSGSCFCNNTAPSEKSLFFRKTALQQNIGNDVGNSTHVHTISKYIKSFESIKKNIKSTIFSLSWFFWSELEVTMRI